MRMVTSNTTVAEKRSALDDLIARLNHGEEIINRLQAENKPIGSLEEHWLRLLQEYEEEYRSLQDAA